MGLGAAIVLQTIKLFSVRMGWRKTSMNPSHNRALAFALCVITTSVNIQGPLYATYARNDGYGVLATTIAFSFYVLGVLPILLALGGLSDRMGRRKVILMSLLLSAAATALMLLYPHTWALAGARFMLGVGTALMSATATVYMIELFGAADTTRAANWVTAGTSIGFGLGPAMTSVCLLFQPTLTPASSFVVLACCAVAWVGVWRLPETAPLQSGPASAMLRLPYFNRRVAWHGGAIFLCWATTGLILSIIPAALAQHGLSHYAGLSSMLAISCGLLFQPKARTYPPQRATQIGLLILLPSFALLAWGAWQGILPVVLVAALSASSSCYGFVYLGGLAGIAEAASQEKARASAAFFLMAYLGFSVPVVFTGVLVDRYGVQSAFAVFGGFLLVGTIVLLLCPPRRSVQALAATR